MSGTAFIFLEFAVPPHPGVFCFISFDFIESDFCFPFLLKAFSFISFHEIAFQNLVEICLVLHGFNSCGKIFVF